MNKTEDVKVEVWTMSKFGKGEKVKRTVFYILIITVLISGCIENGSTEGAKVLNQSKLSTKESQALISPTPVKPPRNYWILNLINKYKFKLMAPIYKIRFSIQKKRLLKGVHEGMTETRVKDILGQPGHESEWVVGQPIFGNHPDLPKGTEYRALNYFINDTKISGIAIYLVSPEQYSNITGKEASGGDWVVITTYLHPRDVIF